MTLCTLIWRGRVGTFRIGTPLSHYVTKVWVGHAAGGRAVDLTVDARPARTSTIG
jgi:hypothetical protein